MSEQSISLFIDERLKSLNEAIELWNKKKDPIVRDAVILRLQRAVSDVFALMHAAVAEEDECECESVEEIIESLRESDLIDDNEQEALFDIVRAVEAISEASEDATINDIMQYMPLY